MAAAAGNAVLDVLLEQDLLAEVTPKGAFLEHELRATFNQHPHVGNIRGRGLFRAIELVEDRYTKSAFDLSLGLTQRLKKTAQDNGLLCYPMAGTIDGKNGDHILLAPPFTISENEMVELVEKLSTTIHSVLA